MLDTLPRELVTTIASFSSQSDCYHLILTNKFMYEACLPRLYDSIIIDSSNQIFHKELMQLNDIVEFKNGKYKGTIIKSCNGLKHFFKTLQRKESLIHLINYLRVKKLPDHFIEFELANHFRFLFERMENLKGCDFQYNSCFINLNGLINSLAKHDKIVELTGDFTMSSSSKKKNMATHGLSALVNIMPSLHLEKLSLISFKNSSYLTDIQLPSTINMLSISKNQETSFPVNYSLVNSIGIDFNYLQDCFNKFFYNGMTNELQNDFNSIFNRASSPLRIAQATSDFDVSTIKSLFARSPHSLCVKQLKFDSIIFDTDDHKILSKHCDLRQLSKLTIIDCDELANSNLIVNLAPSIPNLTELNIRFENNHDVSFLLSQIKNLKKLYISIDDNEWNSLAFFKSLNKHKGLDRLILDYAGDNQLKSIPIKIIEKKLTKHTALKKLRITISIKNLTRFIYNVLPYLTCLEFLELVVEEFNIVKTNSSNSSSTTVYACDEMYYENDNEEYEFNMNYLTPSLLSLNKIKIINRQILDSCPTLKYVKIFNVLLTSQNFIKERGLEDWFTKKLL